MSKGLSPILTKKLAVPGMTDVYIISATVLCVFSPNVDAIDSATTFYYISKFDDLRKDKKFQRRQDNILSWRLWNFLSFLSSSSLDIQ